MQTAEAKGKIWAKVLYFQDLERSNSSFDFLIDTDGHAVNLHFVKPTAHPEVTAPSISLIKGKVCDANQHRLQN